MVKIELNNISKTYVSEFRRRKKRAVDGVSLSIEPTDSFGIIGVNGAGKSTIIKMIMGFISPDSGRIRISGKPPSDPDSRCSIGYLPENPYFYDNLTPKELLMFSCRASGLDRKTAEHRIDLLLDQVGLRAEKDRKLRTFSKGMTQRAGICFALVHDPEIVILDEPMSGLDPLGRHMVIGLIQDLKKRGKTVLFCSHILNDVERICDRVGVMDSGNLKRIYTRKEILENDGPEASLEDLFLTTINRKGE